MKEFTHIEALYQVARHIKILKKDPELKSITMPMTFKGTVKLHGCNCGVECSPNGLVAQSRSRTLTSTDDHFGFAKFVEANADLFRKIESDIRDSWPVAYEGPLTIFGEYIGPGIQGKTALVELPTKQFVIFAAYCNEQYNDAPSFDSVPSAQIYNINDAPSYEVTIDFDDRQNFEDAAELVSRLTKDVENECPWANQFGVKGTGEGIVWKPQGEYAGDERFYFKSKGMKHQGGGEAKIKIAIDPKVLASLTEFATFACNPARLQQGLDYLAEQGLQPDMKHMGTFLKWIGNDIQRECALELEDNGLEWKQVAKPITIMAREFYQQYVINLI